MAAVRPGATESRGVDVTAPEPPASATHRTPPVGTPAVSVPVTNTTVPSALAAPVNLAPRPPLNASDSARRVSTDTRFAGTRPTTRAIAEDVLADTSALPSLAL